MTSADQLRQTLATLGAELSPSVVEGTRKILAPLALRPDASFCSVRRDVSYGSDERHRLDIFIPKSGGGEWPICVYVHGGGFSRGDKGTAEDVFYGNFGAWAAKCGFIGVTMNYRLAPRAQWPNGGEDVATAVRWLHANAESFGGNQNAIVLMGQSAGACNVADGLTRFLDGKKEGVAGAILMSGIYDFVNHDRLFFENGYYGTDAAQWAKQSTLDGLFVQDVPCVFTVSEYDPPNFHRQAAHVVAKGMKTYGRWPNVLFLVGQNHVSQAQVLGAECDNVGPIFASYVREWCGSAAE